MQFIREDIIKNLLSDWWFDKIMCSKSPIMCNKPPIPLHA